jgi:uncharacterized protein YpuA (DUF1002 family)
MKKKGRRLLSLLLAGGLLLMSHSSILATEVSEGENGDAVVITESDKPYLALGADLSAEQQHTVLELMGISAADLDQYDVVYINNEEEHEYLGDYISDSAIGTRSLSSVVIVKSAEGSGLDISTYNINYCTVGMYKNALATAGITDAKIIVAGPFPISGTAALVGAFRAYTELTGETLDEGAVDAAMDELVTTGSLEENLSSTDAQNLEAMIAELKQAIADGSLDSKEDIRAAIEEAAKKYNLDLSSSDIDEILALLQKLKGLNLDWNAIADQASAWAEKLDGVVNFDTDGIGAKITAFFKSIWEAVKSLFS